MEDKAEVLELASSEQASTFSKESAVQDNIAALLLVL